MRVDAGRQALRRADKLVADKLVACVRGLAAVAAVCLLAGSAQAQQGGGLQEQVAATVNDEVISTYDLRQRVLLLVATSGVPATPENVQEIQAESLRSLVDEHLQLQEIRTAEARQGSGSTLIPDQKE